MKAKKYLFQAVVLALCGLSTIADAGQIYRYRNDQGVLVINDRVPPKYAGKGYDVLSPSGRVLQSVLPQQTAEQGAGVQSDGANLQQQRDDEMLLRSYSRVDELKAARDRRLRQVAREIEIIDANLDKSKKLLDSNRAKAANYQRSGKKVPDSLVVNLDQLAVQTKEAKSMLGLRQQHYAAIEAKYLRYIARFGVLKGLTSESQREGKIPPSPQPTAPASAPLADD